MKEITLRPATPQDAPFVAQVMMEAVGHPVMEGQATLDARLTDICRSTDTLYTWQHCTLALNADGQPVGGLIAYPGDDYPQRRRRSFRMAADLITFDVDRMDDETRPGEYYLDSLAVLPAYRRQGIARTLLQHGIQAAHQRHLLPVLACDPNNTGAYRLYTQLGFRTNGKLFIFGEDYLRMIHTVHTIGILGAGHIAIKMARTLQQMPGYRCLAVASRDLPKAQDFARQYDIERAYGSYEELACDPDVQLIYVATPHTLHYRHVRLCLEHGKHVLCEKAFTANAREAEELLRISEEKNLYLSEAIWTRYMPLSHTLQQLLAEGAIGTPHMLSANLCYPVSHKERITSPALGGGALLDIGVYALNFVAIAFGTDVQQITSSCTLSATGVDEQETITLTYPRQRMAVVHSSIICRSDRQGIISGDKGYLVVENINNPASIRVYDGLDNLLHTYTAPPQITGFEYEVEASFQAIEAGQCQSVHMPHAEILRIMRQMDSLRKQWGVRFPSD